MSSAPPPGVDAVDGGTSAPPVERARLHMYNSLSRTKELFVPMSGNRVLWYMCGPTVYAPSHMGHARTYVCFDILRRIMSDYFGYDVVLTMNITDVDDKIIKRSAEAGIPFTTLARQFETEFLSDMASLGVSPPDVLTRVSEYVPEICAYISQIQARGYAYESGGSVYFDTVAYKARHTYGKLCPEQVGNAEALAEGEGVLSAAAAVGGSGAPGGPSLGAGDKRDACDFALWKRSREGEPWWDSPWGHGRPGWHIECTAMCGETLGRLSGASGAIDIHSGGTDLRFPHHDNEIAQSEAYYESQQWVRYFLHSGHLHIEGLKMSKSLKNFVTISEALERFGARQLRLFFLMHRYTAPLSYSEAAMEAMAAVDKLYTEFFANAKAALRSSNAGGGAGSGGSGGDAGSADSARWEQRDHAYARALAAAKARVHACLADDFDTPGALDALSGLVRESNRYLAGGARPVALLLKAAADFVTRIMRVFGLVDPLPAVGHVEAGGGAGGSLEASLGPYLDALAAFRVRVREAARGGDAAAVLAACDALRDESLPRLGVVLEDAPLPGGGMATTWKLRDARELAKEAEERARDAEARAAKKAEVAAEAARRSAEKEAKARVPPADMFRGAALDAQGAPRSFSAWDAEGVPTHDAAGLELPKAAVKALLKERALQVKLHAWWTAKQAGGAGEEAG